MCMSPTIQSSVPKKLIYNALESTHLLHIIFIHYMDTIQVTVKMELKSSSETLVAM